MKTFTRKSSRLSEEIRMGATQDTLLYTIEKSIKKKPDAQTLAKRASAVGPMETDDAQLSDTQAMLNPVASQAILSYRIATLQHRVFEDLKAGNLRWFEAVDLHGCTVEDARSAVLQIIQMAKDENQNVIKIVHGKGPQAILKTHVNSWLRQHRDDVWRFMTDAGVPFTNNLAEQALRMSKVRQKISGCFRTQEGAQTFFTIRSYLATMHKQSACLFECLVSTFKGQPVQPCLAV